MNKVSDEAVEKLFNKFNVDTEVSDYNLNPDKNFTKTLVKIILIN